MFCLNQVPGSGPGSSCRTRRYCSRNHSSRRCSRRRSNRRSRSHSRYRSHSPRLNCSRSRFHSHCCFELKRNLVKKNPLERLSSLLNQWVSSIKWLLSSANLSKVAKGWERGISYLIFSTLPNEREEDSPKCVREVRLSQPCATLDKLDLQYQNVNTGHGHDPLNII